MNIQEIIHVFENCTISSDYFSEAAVTAAYIAGLAALYEKAEREADK